MPLTPGSYYMIQVARSCACGGKDSACLMCKGTGWINEWVTLVDIMNAIRDGVDFQKGA